MAGSSAVQISYNIARINDDTNNTIDNNENLVNEKVWTYCSINYDYGKVSNHCHPNCAFATFKFKSTACE